MGLIVLAHVFYSFIYLKKQAVFSNWKAKMSNKFKKYNVVVNEEGKIRTMIYLMRLRIESQLTPIEHCFDYY